MKSALMERQPGLNPPKKAFLPRKRLPKKRYHTHILGILVVLLQEKKIQKEGAVLRWLTLRKDHMQCLICENIYMYAWVYFSEWERLHYRGSQSLRSGITDNSSLRPCSLSCTSHQATLECVLCKKSSRFLFPFKIILKAYRSSF